MDYLLYFSEGALVGLAIAAPVGPIGVLCIRRTLALGLLCGLASGLGAALADALYGAVAGFGLKAVSNTLQAQGFWLRLVGGGFLIYIGVRTCLAKPKDAQSEPGIAGLAASFISTFLLTLSNPMTILAFAAIYSSGQLELAAADYGATGVLVAGVFTGSLLWWLFLCFSLNLFRSLVTRTVLIWINRLSGALIAGFGLLVLVQSFARFI